jgi:hypothetical protein
MAFELVDLIDGCSCVGLQGGVEFSRSCKSLTITFLVSCVRTVCILVSIARQRYQGTRRSLSEENCHTRCSSYYL